MYAITINANWFRAIIGGVPLDDIIEQLSEPTTRYLIGVAPKDIRKFTKLLSLKRKLLTIYEAKIKYLKMREGIASTKLLRIKYNMDDRKNNNGG